MISFTYSRNFPSFSSLFFSVFVFLSATALISDKAVAMAPVSMCATSVERHALDARVLQTELMVAALSCNEKKQYGQFVHKFQPQLQSQGAVLQSYFSRIYREGGTYQLNRFVTRLANSVSHRNAQTKPSVFCEAAKHLFTEALEQNETSLLQVSAQDRFSSQHGIANCAEKENNVVNMVQR